MGGEAKQLLKNAREGGEAEFKEGSKLKVPADDAAYTAPGRLGNPAMELGSEPRTDVNLLATMKQMGLDANQPPATFLRLSENSTLDEIAEMQAEFETGICTVYEMIPLDLPHDAKEAKVERSEQKIKGGDGQDMIVYIYRPADQSGPLPAVIYSHGGGMTIIPTLNRVHERWCRSIAAQGIVVFMTDFRNAYTPKQYSHFPCGLNDCATAVKWIAANRDSLKIKNIVLQGESGGGNLALATTLKANREGWIKEISGTYAIVPFISNAYGWTQERKLKELPSLVECSGYFLNAWVTAYMAHFYTPTDEHFEDPLAWPYHATLEDMKGLPPHVLVMDELDMLRDEGISYARRLVKAGVDARGSVNLGIVHGSSLIFRAAAPFHVAAARDLASFAKSLSE